MFRARLECELRLHRLRPPCPLCSRKTLPLIGLDEQLIFRCWIHGDWTPDPIEDELGQPLPLFRWRSYDWRFL
jgi:hypothetical protein